MDYSSHSDLPSWNQHTGTKNDEDLYKEIPDQTENEIKEYLMEQLNKNNFSAKQLESRRTTLHPIEVIQNTIDTNTKCTPDSS